MNFARFWISLSEMLRKGVRRSRSHCVMCCSGDREHEDLDAKDKDDEE
jgi:hypothetical protein